MAKGSPPYSNIKPMNALFLIPQNDPPTLEGKFSKQFKDFVSQCLTKDVSKRPIAKELLKHKFIKSAKKNQLLIELIEKKENYFEDNPDEKFTNLYSKYEEEKQKNESKKNIEKDQKKKLNKKENENEDEEEEEDDDVEFKWEFGSETVKFNENELKEEKENEEEKEIEFYSQNDLISSSANTTNANSPNLMETEDETNLISNDMTKRKVK